MQEAGTKSVDKANMHPTCTAVVVADKGWAARVFGICGGGRRQECVRAHVDVFDIMHTGGKGRRQ